MEQDMPLRPLQILAFMPCAHAKYRHEPRHLWDGTGGFIATRCRMRSRGAGSSAIGRRCMLDFTLQIRLPAGKRVRDYARGKGREGGDARVIVLPSGSRTCARVE